MVPPKPQAASVLLGQELEDLKEEKRIKEYPLFEDFG